MSVSRDELSRFIFGSGVTPRFTQDSPVMPDVWLAFGEQPRERHDLLLTPHAESHAGVLAQALHDRLPTEARQASRLSYNQSYVVARLGLRELVRVVLPMTRWWRDYVWPPGTASLDLFLRAHRDEIIHRLQPGAEPEGRRAGAGSGEVSGHLIWLIGLASRIEWERIGGAPFQAEGADSPSRLYATSVDLIGDLTGSEIVDPPPLWSVNCNRAARPAVWRSRTTIKADAAIRLFKLSCAGLRWAVIDTGVDARHPAFARRDTNGALPAQLFPAGGPQSCRVFATYDFTKLRDLIAGQHPPDRASLDRPGEEAVRAALERLQRGQPIDWATLEPLLRIAHDGGYRPPVQEHGTHVAGTLAGDWRVGEPGMPEQDDAVQGICPDLELYDLRVFDDDGVGDEFGILAALQFVRYLNEHSDLQVIHGINQSLSLEHDVHNYACGRTPICDESERLTNSGVVVVVAAGNQGRAQYASAAGATEGYRSISITDPGNAEEVITVGATHRFMPHTYGVSYFSSKGSTGDGRLKPDVVAPGEKITAPVPNSGLRAMDGTSMAAPHVSGAAALLMARHSELIGQPRRVKDVLCRTATDLGRDRYFQGQGIVDVLRAIQSV